MEALTVVGKCIVHLLVRLIACNAERIVRSLGSGTHSDTYTLRLQSSFVDIMDSVAVCSK